MDAQIVCFNSRRVKTRVEVEAGASSIFFLYGDCTQYVRIFIGEEGLGELANQIQKALTPKTSPPATPSTPPTNETH